MTLEVHVLTRTALQIEVISETLSVCYGQSLLTQTIRSQQVRMTVRWWNHSFKKRLHNSLEVDPRSTQQQQEQWSSTQRLSSDCTGKLGLNSESSQVLKKSRSDVGPCLSQTLSNAFPPRPSCWLLFVSESVCGGLLLTLTSITVNPCNCLQEH